MHACMQKDEDGGSPIWRNMVEAVNWYNYI